MQLPKNVVPCLVDCKSDHTTSIFFNRKLHRCRQQQVDVEANTLVVLAFRYTSITSVAMLDAFTIPSEFARPYIIYIDMILHGGFELCACAI